ncbi:MAG: hypothetical protein K2M36_01385, partial [Clostridia bacterium]|nr:hypothetical protein [Clostridia bacterium]
RMHNSNNNAWLRSGVIGGYGHAITVKKNAVYEHCLVTSSLGVRPAIHLNLTATGLGVSMGNPENVTNTYSGDIQTIKSIYDETPSKVAWYNKDYYEHANNYVKVTYEDESGTAVANVKNAGTYWVKTEIQQSWVNAINAEVQADAVKYGWTDTQKTDAKSYRTPKFSGNPVTEDSHVESDIVRWCKLIIEPKELTINKPSFNASTGEFTAPSYTAGATSGFSNVPVLATRFTGTSADGTAFDQIDEIPNKRGTYTAQAILVNSATDKTPYSGGNFTIKDADNMTCIVQVNRARLAIPVSAEPSKPYTGSDVKFILPRSYDASWRDIALLVLPDDGSLKLEGNDTEGWYLVAKEAGTYTVTAALKSDKKSDWCWNTLDGLEVTDDRAITVTITRATLFVDFTSSTGAFLLQKNSNVTFGVGAANAIDGDDVHVSLQYYNAENPDVAIPVPSGKLNAAVLEQGKYRLEAYIEDDMAADNKNYVLDATSSYQDFTISAQGINLPSVSWQFRENGGLATPISGGDTAAAPFETTYTGGTFEFSLAMNAATLANSGVKVDTTFGVNGYQNNSQVNVTDNAVEVKVKLIPYSAEFAFNDENGQQAEEQFKIYSLYVKVNKATIDFSKIVWSADELEYNALAQEVKVISGLPTFIEPEYYGNSEWSIGEYTAGIFSLRVKDLEASKNYIIPSDVKSIPTHSWKIVKKKIPISWIDSEEPTGEGDNVIFIPTLPDNASGAIEYVYYAAQEGVMPPEPDLTNVLGFNDILNYDQTEYKYYFVCAKLRQPTADVRSFSVDNCVLIVGENEATEAYQGFRLGGNKNPVIVSLAKDSVVYNGEQQAAEVEVDSGGLLTESDYTIIYKEKDGDEYRQMSGIPIDAGEYLVVVRISKAQSDTFAIRGEREFAYTIEKADFDMSDMKWVDVLNDNEEYVGPYAYNKDISHKLEYVGKPKFNGEEIDGFSFVCESDRGGAAGRDACRW